MLVLLSIACITQQIITMDDVWNDDHPDDHLQRESNTRRETHYNAGYREGLEEGQQQTIQQGFDAGGFTNPTNPHTLPQATTSRNTNTQQGLRRARKQDLSMGNCVQYRTRCRPCRAMSHRV